MELRYILCRIHSGAQRFPQAVALTVPGQRHLVVTLAGNEDVSGLVEGKPSAGSLSGCLYA
jgi:hypothetical protein